MRYIVYGAGAIGSAIGALLQRSGREVTLIARGAQLDALQRDGLTLETPGGDETLSVSAVGSPADAEIGSNDIVLLAMKTQDTAIALDALAAVAHARTPIVCAQNGVENERLALRQFENVYAMYVFSPCEFVSPGITRIYAAAPAGILDLGRLPGGADERAEEIASELMSAGYDSRPLDDPMRWKYSKLLDNLGNAVQALCGSHDDGTDVLNARARDEGIECFSVAGIEYTSLEERRERTAGLKLREVHGDGHRGGSSWQSLVRGTGTIEASYLNGEIALLGRLHGVPTPVNETLERLAARAAREGMRPGSMTAAEVAAEIERL
jgi:2-dehydropantoate 2-reductase